MQTHNAVSPFIGDKSSDFCHVGLMCFNLFAGDVADHGASNQMHENTRVDLVDLGPPDPDHTHMMNVRPSISFVKSNGYDLIFRSANRVVTHGCLWMLQ